MKHEKPVAAALHVELKTVGPRPQGLKGSHSGIFGVMRGVAAMPQNQKIITHDTSMRQPRAMRK